MSDYVYRTDGTPVGYIARGCVFDLETGEGLGQLKGTHVFTLEGGYVGELRNRAVVKSLLPQGSVAPVWMRPVAPRPPRPTRVSPRLGVVDAWNALLPSEQDAPKPDQADGQVEKEATATSPVLGAVEDALNPGGDGIAGLG